MKKTSIDLDDNEVALIVGEEDGSMTVRVVPATELADGAQEVPEPYEIAVALAMRLLRDPEFHDDVLEWYESQDDEDEDEDDEEDEGQDGGDPGDQDPEPTPAPTPTKPAKDA